MPVDMSGSFGSAINARLADAKKLEKAKNLDQAATVYRQAAYLMRQFADIAPLEDVRKSRLVRVEHLLSLAIPWTRTSKPLAPPFVAPLIQALEKIPDLSALAPLVRPQPHPEIVQTPMRISRAR